MNPVTGDYNLNTFTLPSGYEEGILGSVSEDGTKIAGVAQNSLGKSLGFVYSVPSETFTFFPGPDGAQLTSATITDNGGLVVGNDVDSVNNQQGYVWSVDQPAAAQTARAFFTNHGVTPTTEPFTLNDVFRNLERLFAARRTTRDARASSRLGTRASFIPTF